MLRHMEAIVGCENDVSIIGDTKFLDFGDNRIDEFIYGGKGLESCTVETVHILDFCAGQPRESFHPAQSTWLCVCEQTFREVESGSNLTLSGLKLTPLGIFEFG